ncbi:hypothetical protein GBAR_LOCUS14021 [Geodia barretti]|uniref:Uncharacterized protein n=1 Tax=Geodia barretti TaxID=519541 RepID=A0AA35S6F4_GEOBA|nr:hypothetical protein GBAR_LOCUS14021 [Geodia barretti]
MTTLFLLTTGRVVGLRLTHPDRQLVSGMIINEFNHFTPPVGGDLYIATLDVDKKGWLSSRSSLAQGDP